jgi:hypothetical protein
MSFDLGVWRESMPVTAESAARTYGRLLDGVVDGAEPDARVTAFYEELTARFPELCDLQEEDIESSPWMAGLDVSPAHVIMTISWSRAGEIALIVQELAAAHELLYFDPQKGTVCQAPQVAAVPGMKLISCDGSMVANPGPSQIRTAVKRLSSTTNWYVVLEEREEWYVQAGLGANAGAPDEHFGLEYRAGSEHEHFRCIVSASDDVVEAFEAFARGETRWRQGFSWKRVKF